MSERQGTFWNAIERVAYAEFDKAWSDLERVSMVDAFGGAEYRRLKACWIKDACPFEAYGWLVKRINQSPTAKGGPGS